MRLEKMYSLHGVSDTHHVLSFRIRELAMLVAHV